MFDIDKLYDSSIINEANTDFKEEDIIIRLEKSYYNELLKANKEYINLQKKEFKNLYGDSDKKIYKEVVKILLGKKIKVKHMNQWFEKINNKLLSTLIENNHNTNFRYHIVSKYLKKDKYSNFSRAIVNLPEDICIFNIEDKSIQDDIKDNKLYKQLENILDLTDIITWKNHPAPRQGLFTKKLIPEYLFGSIRDIDLAMNKTHCIKIDKGNYKIVDIVNIIDDYMKYRELSLKTLFYLVKDIKEQISLYKEDSKHYMESFSDQYMLSKVFLDDMDHIMDNMYYIYRRLIKQINDVDKIYSIIVNDIYDRLIKYRKRENDVLNKSYDDNKKALYINKRI